MIDLDTVLARMPGRRTLIASALVFIAVVALAGGAWYWHSASERQAAARYAAALAEVQGTRAPQAAPEARANATRALEGALQAFPSSRMAAQAAYELGTLRYADRQYAPARSAYEITLARGAAGTLRTLAKLGIATTWEAERNVAKATEAYQAVLADLKPTDPFYEVALLDLARVHELAGRKDDAIATYRRALKDVPRTTRGDDVKLRLANLGVAP